MRIFQYIDVLSLRNCWDNVFLSPGTFREIVHPISLLQLDGKNSKSCLSSAVLSVFHKRQRIEDWNFGFVMKTWALGHRTAKLWSQEDLKLSKTKFIQLTLSEGLSCYLP